MKKVIYSDKAPAAVGPYAHANAENGFVYVSGQLGINPETGKMDEDVLVQARQGLENLKNILEDAGAGLDTVVKTLVFLTDISDFAEVNKIYAEYFGENSPARSCVEVSALPLGGKFEIEAVATEK